MYIYNITITQVSLEQQGEWTFSYNDKHTITSDHCLTKAELDELVKDIPLEIEADTDDPYELGYVIEEYEFTKEGGVKI